MYRRSNQPHPLAAKYPRLTGVLTLLAGLAVLYFSVVEPILHARVGEAIKLSEKGGLVGFAFAIAGLAFILFGATLMNWNRSAGEKSYKVAGILGGIFAVGWIIAMKLL